MVMTFVPVDPDVVRPLATFSPRPETSTGGECSASWRDR
jgi:hypothetical protein